LKVQSKRNCYNEEKVLSFVAPSGEQKLTWRPPVSAAPAL